MSKLTQSQLHSLLNYDPITGLFRWNARRGSVSANAVAGTFNTDGYRQISINHRLYTAHRLAWLYVHGQWPKETIDHINRVKDDNRISNLREATRRENSKNIGPLRSNKARGVTWHKRSRKWCAYIIDNGKHRHLGYFKTFPEAVAARDSFAKKLSEYSYINVGS